MSFQQFAGDGGTREPGRIDNPSYIRVLAATILGLCIVISLLPGRTGGGEIPKVMITPPVAWLPPPVSVPNSQAQSQDEMKPYRELIWLQPPHRVKLRSLG